MKRVRSPDPQSTPQDAPEPTFVFLRVPVGHTNPPPPQLNVTWTVSPLLPSSQPTPRLPWTPGPMALGGNNRCPLMTSGPWPLPAPLTIQAAAAAAAATAAPSMPLFFTWNLDNIEICDQFLQGVCPLADRCTKHHTPLPYCWQLYNSEVGRWVDIQFRAQLLLERMYCNVDRDTLTLIEGPARFKLDLDDMEILDDSKYTHARRLSNSDSFFLSPYFFCQWRIYWWNQSDWAEYDQGVSVLLLSRMALKEPMVSFMRGSQKYIVDFTDMTQTNVTTGFQRVIRCRPAYRPLESFYPHLKTGILLDPIPQPFHPNFNVDPLENFTTWYPPVWQLDTAEECRLLDVPPQTKTFQMIQKVFYQSLPETKVDIVIIQQVQNTLHWDKYQRQKVHMENKLGDSQELLERHLFHGTTRGAAELICCLNFDPRLAGVHGKILGHASYFAASASMSHDYAVESAPDGLRHMFLAKVLVGKVTEGQLEYLRPPPCDSGTGFYDACVDDVLQPSIFAVFDNRQCYPYYLIKYKELKGVVKL
ncbi:protein mono-ADP-ribosyltransferase TIPARP-like isoform X2 [Syngnathus scovelli]|uniref:protein mono-ADP-ribosyltransferase TIPARP-like isoform X2 n=1 Tax=Syngnathus scovelli TaxID=161590 RepID=UPI00210F3517|nr:protein mono-ADP-ribosyltransferase TIPARP-like isoform X2 [Syngnathus scovelli]